MLRLIVAMVICTFSLAMNDLKRGKARRELLANNVLTAELKYFNNPTRENEKNVCATLGYTDNLINLTQNKLSFSNSHIIRQGRSVVNYVHTVYWERFT